MVVRRRADVDVQLIRNVEGRAHLEIHVYWDVAQRGDGALLPGAVLRPEAAADLAVRVQAPVAGRLTELPQKFLEVHGVPHITAQSQPKRNAARPSAASPKRSRSRFVITPHPLHSAARICGLTQ